jgi:hypothetical protein
MADVASDIAGFCWLIMNPFGPAQLYDVIPPGLPNRYMVLPMQTGELLAAEATGSAWTVMSVSSKLLLATGSVGFTAVMLAELIIVVPPVPALTVAVRLRVALLEAAKPPTTHRPVVLL